jgi:hypothetical protein
VTETGTWQILAAFLDVRYYQDGIRYMAYQTGDTTTLTITKYGDVGDTIEGTFSSLVSDDGDTTTIQITDGHFKVRRLPDDSVSF